MGERASAQRTTADQLLRDARAKLERLTPPRAAEAMDRGDLLIDIRPLEQRVRDGAIPGAHVVARNVLEWRLDPASPHRSPELSRRDRRVIVLCDEGYQSSLAAATLRSFGLDATDVSGGAQEWIRCGLPVEATGSSVGGAR
ncbi:MAG TPA: rhodanese-like domain-containing protein [Vicinamibacterales bacterium]|nr:rhodanese-like domain-containing protein [Vicinamibacterales bacterium]